MSAAASRSEHQRATGELRVSIKLRDGRGVLEGLRQEGCLKARFPRPVDWMEITTLNTSGGIAGGDFLRSALVIRPGARATITSQTAERFYRALDADPPADIRTEISVGAGAACEWLPQESILFDGCAMDRTLAVDIAADGWFLGVESLVLGRAAMGERVRTARVRDAWRVRRDGRWLLHEAIRLGGDVTAQLAGIATARGQGAMATIVLVSPDAADRLDAVRGALGDAEAGASAWNGMLVARIVAPDGAALRAGVMAVLDCLRNDRTLPRVWQC